MAYLQNLKYYMYIRPRIEKKLLYNRSTVCRPWVFVVRFENYGNSPKKEHNKKRDFSDLLVVTESYTIRSGSHGLPWAPMVPMDHPWRPCPCPLKPMEAHGSAHGSPWEPTGCCP